MIERGAYAEGMQLLIGAHGRGALPVALARAYYATLSPRLTTAEFRAAVDASLARDTWWPSPARLLELAQRSEQQLATEAFNRLRRDLEANGGYQWYPSARYAALDEPTRFAIRECGGLRALGQADERQHPALVKQFVAAYLHASRGAGSPATPEPVASVRAATGGGSP